MPTTKHYYGGVQVWDRRGGPQVWSTCLTLEFAVNPPCRRGPPRGVSIPLPKQKCAPDRPALLMLSGRAIRDAHECPARRPARAAWLSGRGSAREKVSVAGGIAYDRARRVYAVFLLLLLHKARRGPQRA